ncbi:alkaline phosphatase D family protein [Thermithiobacillus plumbiphilus]|uniref:Alkaline phosphatase D family protein n=1 Tax=Thermithiobacillus plumbiphilus TaxID=1729899 RepID=A0ABU9DA74_9PROT
MHRRKFLKALLATGSAAWLTGCYGGSEMQSGYARPVGFVPEPALPDLSADFEVDPALDPQPVFSLGIAAGDPRPHGIVLWTRIDPKALGNLKHLAYEIASDPSFSKGTVLVRGLANLSAENDHTVKLPLEHQALQAFTTYYYRFIYNKTASRSGRFKTLPEADAQLAGLRFAFISCQDYSNGYYTALAHLAQEEVDFVLFLGDYIYETVGDPSFQGAQVRRVPPLPSGGTVAAGLDDYRHLYRTYKADPDLQALHERFSVIQLWDDHEFANDAWQDHHPDNNPDPAAATPLLRQAANQAWAEYGLADVPFDPQQAPLESIRLYRSFRFGKLMELVATDERLYRDGPPCGNATEQRYVTQRCAAAEDTARSMLGGNQRDWFLKTITESPATWKIWANEVTLMQMKLGGQFITLDQWDGYPAERAQLLTALQDAGVRNFIAVTGDIHSFIAGYLKRNFDDLLEMPVAVELVVGSVSSANFLELVTSQIPLPSAPVPTSIPLMPGASVENALILNNPHMRFFNSSTHGYCLMNVSPTKAVCTMKAVSTIREQTASVQILTRFTVPRDQVILIEG